MQLDTRPEPVTEDDATIRAHLEGVDTVPLLAAVAHATGRPSLLRPELRPEPTMLMQPNAGLSEALIGKSRDHAARALARWRDEGCPPNAPLSPGAQRSAVDFVTGGAVTGEWVRLLDEELAADGTDPRAPAWRLDELAPGRRFDVAIVGAGMSGIAVAHRLRQAGVKVTIYEKNADVGGTWLENTYPGCRVDIPNHMYSYSFAQSATWPHYYSTQGVLLDYFRTCFDRLGLRERTRFETEVVSATWHDGEKRWVLRTLNAGGRQESTMVDAVVTAVGQLNRPKLPALPGMDRFEGEAFHSARWNDSVDLAGRRVGVVGTGASAVQLIPHVARLAGSVTIFQRSAPWLLPTPGYRDDLDEGLRWTLRKLPQYARWDRLWAFWRIQGGLLPMSEVHPGWSEHGSVSPLNDALRRYLTDYLTAQFPDPDLRSRVVPDYPPLAKRFVRDDGTWAHTLTRDNVQLVTDSIVEVDRRSVRTSDGADHPVDVLIYGTGFDASNFLAPMLITGRGGTDLHERWGGDARAYLGMTVPGYPNFFVTYGPNTNLVVNGSITLFSECQAGYIADCIRLLVTGGHQALECRADVHARFNERIDAANRARAWGVPSVNSWYKNESGRVSQNWPFGLLEYWQATRTPHAGDYDLT